MSPLAFLYFSIVAFRNFLYNKGVLPIYRFDDILVISVGNIEVGGTGKTPFAAFLIEYFSGLGFQCAYLSRGYGRETKGFLLIDPNEYNATQVGDEALMIALRYPHVPVAVCEDRVQGTRELLKRSSFHILILDDAFQHRRIHRDIDVVLVNGSRKFFYEKIFPLGRLREPRFQLKRANLVVINKIKSKDHIKSFERRLPYSLVFTRYVPAKCVNANTKEEVPFSFLAHRPLILLSAIAWNEDFNDLVLSFQGYILRHFAFRDHTPITKQILERIIADWNKAQKNPNYRHSPIVVTTEKDYARMVNQEQLQPLLSTLPLYYITISLEFVKGYEYCENLIEKKIKEHKVWNQKLRKSLEKRLTT